jgi:hypothetical protein
MRLHIKRHNTVGAKSEESVEERIRRIREDNKKREQRFQEIQEDKKMALEKEKLLHTNHRDNKTKPCKNTTMKGVQSANIKRAKGRGQMLKELSNNPLKAERFKSKLESQIDNCKHPNSQIFRLENNCRSSIREKINSKNRVCSDTQPLLKHEEMQENDISKLITVLDDQQNEIPEGEKETTCCETNQQTNETDEVLKNVEQQEIVSELKNLNTLNKQLDKEPSTTKKKEKPKITVTLKKTASSSSFDESMAMLSPLDVPQNWGDVDFSDEELPPVSIWKDP